jgi:hypothetical protein
VAFDVGSSGIRAAATHASAEAKVDIDFLAPVLAGHGLDPILEATAVALRELPQRAGFDPGCAHIAAGFSAWREALRSNPQGVARAVARLRRDTGVLLLVLPQSVEGTYAHAGAAQRLGARLATSHVLDIGGGSLQVAGRNESFGAPLGQKLWHLRLCQRLRGSDAIPCALPPISATELGTARRVADDSLAGALALARPLNMTAVSRPVTRGILPALRALGLAPPGADGIALADLTAAVERLAGLGLDEALALTGAQAPHGAYLLSDLLLVEGLLRATGGNRLAVAETEINNLPGILADDRAFDWAGKAACYLGVLEREGERAYYADPALCPAGQ